ncbi:P-loop containing nucleoside triphosphate hydrolase protein, partial [Blyttiomyces helicus]
MSFLSSEDETRSSTLFEDRNDQTEPEEPTEPAVKIDTAIAEYHATKADVAKLSKANNDTEAAVDAQFDLQDFLEGGVRKEKQAGLKRQRLGVTWRDLTVVGEGADASSIATIVSPFEALGRALNPANWLSKASKGTDFNIISKATGYCREGEMLLVLGRPGSGCSTFLRVLANMRDSYKEVQGDVSYGGIAPADFKQYSGQVIYTAEEDVHFPTLTVEQTLSFSLRTKTPGARVAEEAHKRSFRERVAYMLVNMLGLVKQVQTLVGNEFIRGLSGGERKRMTIAEAMTAHSAIYCWDCTTRGLDSASALDYTKSLRILGDTLNKTSIATFYQASEDMYKEFDNVMVLDKGRTIFFGPVARAKQYFIELGFDCEPRKSTPDYLTGVTNPQERKIRPGFEGKVPATASQLEAAWL